MHMTARKSLSTLALWTALAMPAALLPLPAAQAQVAVDLGISVGIAPPPLPLYDQPPLPAPGYIWTPGYWAYGDGGYYWVPGAWVLPPLVGMLWTPGYWGYYDGFYRWHPGYWGRRVGFYGGVDYGYGYGGIGFVGGRWSNGVFAYNRAVVNFGRTRVTHVYDDTVVVRRQTIVNRSRISYNGGAHGIQRRPPAQEARMIGRRLPPTASQDAMRRTAGRDRGQARFNPGRPSAPAAAGRAAYGNRGPMDEGARPTGAPGRGPGQRYQPSMGQRQASPGRPARMEQMPGAPRGAGPQGQPQRAHGNPARGPDRADFERPMRMQGMPGRGRAEGPGRQPPRAYGNPGSRSRPQAAPAARGHRSGRNDGQRRG